MKKRKPISYKTISKLCDFDPAKRESLHVKTNSPILSKFIPPTMEVTTKPKEIKTPKLELSSIIEIKKTKPGIKKSQITRVFLKNKKPSLIKTESPQLFKDKPNEDDIIWSL